MRLTIRSPVNETGATKRPARSAASAARAVSPHHTNRNELCYRLRRPDTTVPAGSRGNRMMSEHLLEYGGLPVFAFSAETDPSSGLPPARDVAWHLSWEWDSIRFADVFDPFLDAVDTTQVSHLIIGYWGSCEDDVYPPDILIDAVDRFPALRSLFLGYLHDPWQEFGYVASGNLDPLLRAFPALERLDVHGDALELSPFRSETLRTLRFESDALPAEVVRAVGAGELPGLEHLAIWLGYEAGGCTVTLDDLA
ncbi:hypothetical protein ACWEPC_46040, partial [Nonomuraea sp. NPDC004297]